MQVQLSITFSNSEGYFCGGTIIGARTILTAAHCMINEEGRTATPSEVKVTIGTLTLDGQPQDDPTGCSELFNVSKVRRNPAYDPASSNNDVTVLTLDRAIDFQNKPCACALCLEDLQPSVGDRCIVSGSGAAFEGDDGTKYLAPNAIALWPFDILWKIPYIDYIPWNSMIFFWLSNKTGYFTLVHIKSQNKNK